MKKKLVMEYWSSKNNTRQNLPQNALSRQLWLCEIMYKSRDGVVEEFEVKPECKLLLVDLLPHVNELLGSIVPEDAVDCGFRIYQRK